MSEHRFTDESATTIVVGTLINDMHHVLGRIQWACYWFGVLPFVSVIIHATEARWVAVGLDLFAWLAFVALGAETGKRRRKYRPAVTKRKATR